MSQTELQTPSEVINTKQYRRFAEFCDACRDEKYIGLCYGPPGVGKTFSARHYSHWNLIEEYSHSRYQKEPAKKDVCKLRTLFYTAEVNATARMVQKSLDHNLRDLAMTIETSIPARKMKYQNLDQFAELLIVDEADRLKLDALEQVRDFHDRTRGGLVLIGMPGLEKRLTRYPQLYSRVGFAHEFKGMNVDEVKFLLERKSSELGLSLDVTDFTDQEALASIVRITGGNFRLIQRLLSQVQRIMRINNLKLLTKEVIETARENLVIGLS
jgi:DNA transposition AAA+ family ATPase